MKRTVLTLIILLSSVGYVFSQNRKPRLIIGIVVEQMRYDFVSRYWDKFSDNGFKRLVKNGLVYHNAGYDYLNINTYSSLANLATGTYPYIHGIIGKQWYDKFNNQIVNCVADQETFIIGKKHPEFAGSPKQLLAKTFSDQLSMHTFGASKIVVIAPTMEQAIISGGYLADEVYWFDTEKGKWVSSSYYFRSEGELPYWVKVFNRRKFPDIYLNNVWQPSLPLSQYNESLADQSLGEKGLAGQTVFPYDLKQLKRKVSNKYELFMHTPFFNTFVKDFAISSMVYDQVGRDDVTDYLFIVFPATSYVSQVFGIRSVETEDAYLKLDKDLAYLLEALDDIVGKDNYLLFLTSDRGACDNPSLLKNMDLPVSFFNPLGTKLVLNAYLRALYGQPDLTAVISDNQIYLNQNKIDKAKIDQLEIQRNTASFYAQFKSVQYAIPTQLLLQNSFSSGVMYLAFHSFHPKRSGDVIFCLKPGAYIENQDHSLPSYSECYCSCNNNNQFPLIFYGAGIEHKNVYRRVDITSVAPTLSMFLGIQLPENSTAPIFPEFFSQ